MDPCYECAWIRTAYNGPTPQKPPLLVKFFLCSGSIAGYAVPIGSSGSRTRGLNVRIFLASVSSSHQVLSFHPVRLSRSQGIIRRHSS